MKPNWNNWVNYKKKYRKVAKSKVVNRSYDDGTFHGFNLTLKPGTQWCVWSRAEWLCVQHMETTWNRKSTKKNPSPDDGAENELLRTCWPYLGSFPGLVRLDRHIHCAFFIHLHVDSYSPFGWDLCHAQRFLGISPQYNNMNLSTVITAFLLY